jgi:hypothetical protein
MVGAREQQEVHGGQEQQRTSLGEWRAIEEREQVVIVGDGATDGGVGAATVTLDDRGEAPEVVSERLLEHRCQKLAGSSGVIAPKKNHSSTSVPTAPTP